MKKSVIFFIFLILLLKIIPLSIAQSGLDDSLKDNIDVIEDKKEQIEDLSVEDVKSQYLKKEWGKMFESNKFFEPFISGYNSLKPLLDPIFRYTIGVDTSLTWPFILALVLSVTFAVYLYRAISGFSTFSEATSLVISLALTVALGNFGFWKFFSDKIIGLIMLFTIWWVQLILVLIVIIGLSISNKFSVKFKNFIKKKIEKREKEKEKRTRKEFEEAKDTAVKFSKGITDALIDEDKKK